MPSSSGTQLTLPGTTGMVWLYARVSTQIEESDTTESQLQEMKRWAETNGYLVVGESIDRSSGRTMDNRDGLALALEKASEMRAKVAVVEQSRLSRSLKDTAELMDGNVEFIFTRSGTTMSREMCMMFGLFAQMEAESIARRVKAGIANHFETPGAREEWARARWREDIPERLSQARRSKADAYALKHGEMAMLMWRENGMSLRHIAETYMAMGVETARGTKKWHANSIRRLVERYEQLINEQ